jgi:hypothetical protein
MTKPKPDAAIMQKYRIETWKFLEAFQSRKSPMRNAIKYPMMKNIMTQVIVSITYLNHK